MPRVKEDQKTHIGSNKETPKEQIEICLKCQLPDCCPTSKSCGLRIHLAEKYGKRVKLK